MALLFENPDKVGGAPRAAPGIPAWPWRLLISGPPGSGKRASLMNILATAKDWPDRIIVVHLDPETSGANEYAWADEVVDYDNVPDFEGIPGPDDEGEIARTLVVLDEAPWHSLKKDQVSNIERLANFVSTHRNTSICIQAQQAMKVPPSIRRAMNWLIMCGGVREAPERQMLAQRIGIDGSDFVELLDLLRRPHDSLSCDLTEADPLRRWRLNLSVPIRHVSTQK